MTYHLDEHSVRSALKNLCRYGDTDIFPHLAELSFLAEEEASVVNEVASLDLDSFRR